MSSLLSHDKNDTYLIKSGVPEFDGNLRGVLCFTLMIEKKNIVTFDSILSLYHKNS